MSDKTISAVLFEELKARSLKIASVESCTAGLVSKLITDVAGSSEVFDLGITTYSNEMKTKMVGVPKEILDAHGAVSEQTARAMAEGIREVSGADIGVSTTGIAGPGGGTPEKPVGLVYMAVAGPNGVQVKRCLFSDEASSRSEVRSAAAEAAVEFAVEYIRQLRTDNG